MPRFAANKMPAATKREYFQLIRQGAKGAEAARRVGVSMSCGSLWFIDAGGVTVIETTPISSRFLTQDDRIEIADGLDAGEPVKVIAARIGKSFQSVYRELARNRKPDGRYQPFFAHNEAFQRRRRTRVRMFVEYPQLAEAVAGKLRLRWSPGQVSRWLRRRYPRRPSWHVCTETIYDAVYRGLILNVNTANLRTRRTYRHKRGRGRSRDGALKQLTAMTSIHDRPASVETRRQAGHWEGDLIVGAHHMSAVATLVERKTRLTVLVRLPGGHSAQNVADALIRTLSTLPASLRRSLTWDQGNEMFQHGRIHAATGVKIYFADPHAPWQRASNENTNGLLRQYLPKGTDLNRWNDNELDAIADELNDRPRAVLGDRSPAQVMRRLGHHALTRTIRNHR